MWRRWMTRGWWLLALLVAVLGGVLSACGGDTARERAEATPRVEVYKSPTCGCCGAWVKHLRANGFDVVVYEVDNVAPIKARYGVPKGLASCHTAVVDGYVIEGHVPAEAVWRLLRERPNVVGLAVPGMPLGAPGMEVPDGTVQPFDVLAFDRQGQTQVFASYGR